MFESNSGKEMNPAAKRFERHLVDALPPAPNHDPVPRRLYLKRSEFMTRNVGSLLGLQCIKSVVVAHRVTPRNVEIVSRENSGRQRRESSFSCRSQSSGRALERVQLASAPSNLPAEAASSSSAPTLSVNLALLASAVRDQAMSEGASGSSNAAWLARYDCCLFQS